MSHKLFIFSHNFVFIIYLIFILELVIKKIHSKGIIYANL